MAKNPQIPPLRAPVAPKASQFDPTVNPANSDTVKSPVRSYVVTLDGGIFLAGTTKSAPAQVTPFVHDNRAAILTRAHNTSKITYVDDLVAKAFHGKAPKGTSVIHLNGDITNNRAQNLAYALPQAKQAFLEYEAFKRAASQVPASKAFDIARLARADFAANKITAAAVPRGSSTSLLEEWRTSSGATSEAEASEAGPAEALPQDAVRHLAALFLANPQAVAFQHLRRPLQAAWDAARRDPRITQQWRALPDMDTIQARMPQVAALLDPATMGSIEVSSFGHARALTRTGHVYLPAQRSRNSQPVYFILRRQSGEPVPVPAAQLVALAFMLDDLPFTYSMHPEKEAPKVAVIEGNDPALSNLKWRAPNDVDAAIRTQQRRRATAAQRVADKVGHLLQDGQDTFESMLARLRPIRSGSRRGQTLGLSTIKEVWQLACQGLAHREIGRRLDLCHVTVHKLLTDDAWRRCMPPDIEALRQQYEAAQELANSKMQESS